MADKKISDFTAAATVASTDLLEIETAGGNSRKITVANFKAHRGALVKKSADQTGANYTTATAIAWDAEEYDTDSIHDNVTNNSRLTVPAGVPYVQLWASVTLANITTSLDMTLIIRKNGAVFIGRGATTIEADTTTPSATAMTAVVAVSPGDYFEAYLTITTDTTVDVLQASSAFAMEIKG
jgi:hypothetical protein